MEPAPGRKFIWRLEYQVDPPLMLGGLRYRDGRDLLRS